MIDRQRGLLVVCLSLYGKQFNLGTKIGVNLISFRGVVLWEQSIRRSLQKNLFESFFFMGLRIDRQKGVASPPHSSWRQTL